MDCHRGEWWFNKPERTMSREAASGVTTLSISATNMSVYIIRRRRVVRVMEGLVILGDWMVNNIAIAILFTIQSPKITRPSITRTTRRLRIIYTDIFVADIDNVVTPDAASLDIVLSGLLNHHSPL